VPFALDLYAPRRNGLLGLDASNEVRAALLRHAAIAGGVRACVGFGVGAQAL